MFEPLRRYEGEEAAGAFFARGFFGDVPASSVLGSAPPPDGLGFTGFFELSDSAGAAGGFLAFVGFVAGSGPSVAPG